MFFSKKEKISLRFDYSIHYQEATDLGSHLCQRDETRFCGSLSGYRLLVSNDPELAKQILDFLKFHANHPGAQISVNLSGTLSTMPVKETFASLEELKFYMDETGLLSHGSSATPS